MRPRGRTPGGKRVGPFGRVAAWACLLALTALPCLGAAPAEVLPPSGFEGWVREGRVRTYAGPALYDHIDGGAEPLLELGFEACSVARYARGKMELTAEVYAMSDAVAALGTYLMQCGQETPEPAVEDRNTAGENQMTVLKGRHLVRLTGRPGACPAREVFARWARSVAGKLPGDAPPAILDLLPGEGAVAGSLRIVRGAVTLQVLAPPFEPDALPFAPGSTGAAVDVGGPGGVLRTHLAVSFPDARTAVEALAGFLGAVGGEPGKPLVLEGGQTGSARVEGALLRLEWGPGTPQVPASADPPPGPQARHFTTGAAGGYPSAPPHPGARTARPTEDP